MPQLLQFAIFLGYLAIGMLWCFGIYKIMDGLLSKLAGKIQMRIGAFWCMPLFLCPACMGSFHGIIVFFLAAPLVLGPLPWFIAPVYCICLCGLNYIVNQSIPE